MIFEINQLIDKLWAHRECWVNDNNSICTICGNAYIDDDDDDMVYDKSLLRFGHLLDKQCLDQHERDLWEFWTLLIKNMTDIRIMSNQKENGLE